MGAPFFTTAFWNNRVAAVTSRLAARRKSRVRPFSRDPDDDMVLECAVASGANTVVTHNLKDFARARSLGVQAKTPGQFLKNLKGK